MDKFWFFTLGLLVGWLVHWAISALFCKCKCTNNNCNKHGNGNCAGKPSTNYNTTESTNRNVQSLAGLATDASKPVASRITDTSVSHTASSFTAAATTLAAIVPSGLYQTTDGKDDLKVIEGIGPKISELLNNAGIHHFHVLAQTPVTTLETILKEAGTGFQMANPETWPEQAALIAKGDKAGFEKLTDELKGGVRVS